MKAAIHSVHSGSLGSVAAFKKIHIHRCINHPEQVSLCVGVHINKNVCTTLRKPHYHSSKCAVVLSENVLLQFCKTTSTASPGTALTSDESTVSRFTFSASFLIPALKEVRPFEGYTYKCHLIFLVPHLTNYLTSLSYLCLAIMVQTPIITERMCLIYVLIFGRTEFMHLLNWLSGKRDSFIPFGDIKVLLPDVFYDSCNHCY